jgi:hypothetical protein
LNIVGGHLIPTVLTSSEEAERLGLEAALAAVVGLRVSFVFFLWKRYQYFEA